MRRGQSSGLVAIGDTRALLAHASFSATLSSTLFQPQGGTHALDSLCARGLVVAQTNIGGASVYAISPPAVQARAFQRYAHATVAVLHGASEFEDVSKIGSPLRDCDVVRA